MGAKGFASSCSWQDHFPPLLPSFFFFSCVSVEGQELYIIIMIKNIICWNQSLQIKFFSLWEITCNTYVNNTDNYSLEIWWKKKKYQDCLEQFSHPYKFYRWKRVKRGVCVCGGNDCSAIYIKKKSGWWQKTPPPCNKHTFATLFVSRWVQHTFTSIIFCLFCVAETWNTMRNWLLSLKVVLCIFVDRWERERERERRGEEKLKWW